MNINIEEIVVSNINNIIGTQFRFQWRYASTSVWEDIYKQCALVFYINMICYRTWTISSIREVYRINICEPNSITKLVNVIHGNISSS